MRPNPYKDRLYKEWLVPRLVGASIGFIIILVVVIIVSMNNTTVILNEGITKSIPLLSNDKMKILGDMYIKKQHIFEQEIMNMEINYANRTNKRGDKIFYGVNGKENPDELVNIDYVNGIESIKYVKGKAKNRKDGDSNFVDMVSFLSAALGSDIDRYTDEQLVEIFDKLFDLTHTFTGSSTELYPCDHGCAWCKYYCGDSRCQGELNGNTVGFYESDMYMGKEGEYGLMYDPFLISKYSNYPVLRELASNKSKNRTSYQYNVIESTFIETSDGGYVIHEIKPKWDTVVTEDDEIFELMEPDGYCPVCSGGSMTFTNTTRKFGGCMNQVECHHGWVEHIDGDDEDDPGYDVFWYMGRDKLNCEEPDAEFACSHEHSDTCRDENGDCRHEKLMCKPDDIGCEGYYVCSDGHDHYACPGHILVCCFGHTNLNLEIKIMYYEDMIDTIKELIN